MNTIFLKILDMSFMASWLMIAVILLRLLLKKAPKWIVCMLWILVGVRLICPFTVESTWSLVPDSGFVLETVLSGLMTPDEGVSGENISGEDPAGIGAYDEFSDGSRGEIMMPGVNIPEADYSEYENMDGINASDDYLPESRPNDLRNDHIDYDNDNISARNALTDSVINTLGIVWVTGVALMLLYGFVSYFRLHKITAVSVEVNTKADTNTGTDVNVGADVGKNVFRCDAIDTPFILGIIRPRIYLPSNMEDSWTEYVIAHEKTHIRRRDHWWKPMGFLILSVYWFNPLCWLSYILLCRDIELACDEAVIKTMDSDSKKIYAKALLSCSVKQKMITACPLAFGEVGIKERIRGVMNYKKPAFWIVAISLIACIIVAVCFLTNPKTEVDIEENDTESDAGIQMTDLSNESEYEYLSFSRGIVIMGYNGEDTSVIIPEMIDGSRVIRIGDKAFMDCDNIESITIPDSVIEIGTRAFEGCNNLTVIYRGQEYNSSNLNELYELIEDKGDYEYIYVSDLGGVAITKYIGDDSSLTIPNNIDGYSVVRIDDFAFKDCSDITNVIIPESIVSIGRDAFGACSNLTDITIPDSVITIERGAFYNCISLVNITIPDSVTSIGNSIFMGCSNLKEVILSNNITSIENDLFNNCYSLSNVTIPDSVTYISDYAFNDCSSLTSIIIPDSVTDIGEYAFEGCSSLTNIIIPNSVVSIGSSAFANCTELTDIVIPDSITLLSHYMFGNCSSLTNITIPDSVTEIDGHAFAWCSSLTEIIIPDGVTTIKEYTFAYCSSLTSVSIPDNITYIGTQAFESCSNLTNIILPDSVTRIGSSAFRNCSNLTNIILPDSVTYIGIGAFNNCSSLTSITIPESVTTIRRQTSYWHLDPFSGCDNLTIIYKEQNYTTENMEDFYALFDDTEEDTSELPDNEG